MRVSASEKKALRQFLPADLNTNSWEELEPWFEQLANRELNSLTDLEQWMRDADELESALSEAFAWSYIRSSCDTNNEEFEKAYTHLVSQIEPKCAPWFDKFRHKLNNSPFVSGISRDFGIYLKTVQNDIAIYREENIAILAEIDQLRQQYAKISGEQMVTLDGEEMTIVKAFNGLKNPDRQKRLETFEAIWKRRGEDREKLDDLFDTLTAKRQQVARQAGFSNFRDYMFVALSRFDYTAEDCFTFHDAIAQELVPVLAEMDHLRREKLNVDKLRPWDLDADTSGKPALVPFQGGDDLLEKSIRCLERVNPRHASFLRTMREMGHFDLDSRKGKAPGGYNYGLAETGVPFIFMNAAGSHRDVVTMVHEAGHAIHSFLMNPLPTNPLRNPPSEVCELASMAMELITMEHWDVFYPNPDDLKRARIEQLDKLLRTLCWVATVDAFQHWIYENENHTREERSTSWDNIYTRFESPVIDWSGHEEKRYAFWQKQLHIFEIPFYYIEYAMAQLGAIAVWRNYKTNPELALQHYEAALSLGNTRSIGEIYQAAGIRFDFSSTWIKELAQFVKAEINQLS
jgi:oligoendopeptidase F